MRLCNTKMYEDAWKLFFNRSAREPTVLMMLPPPGITETGLPPTLPRKSISSAVRCFGVSYKFSYKVRTFPYVLLLYLKLLFVLKGKHVWAKDYFFIFLGDRINENFLQIDLFPGISSRLLVDIYRH